MRISLTTGPNVINIREKIAGDAVTLAFANNL
jgi:hypothetical protein